MTRNTTMDKETLAAFADGELTPEQAAAVVIHLADHPEDQAYLDEVMAANLLLSRAFAAPMQEPVPDRLAALILNDDSAKRGQVLPFRKRAVPRMLAVGVLSAGIAAAAALATVALLPGGGSGLSVGPVAAGSVLHKALAGQVSGQPVPFADAEALRILASLPAAEGYCREFEVVSETAQQLRLGLACQQGEGWTVDVLLAETVAVQGSGGPDYAAASGSDIAAINRWLDRRGAGLALTADEEAEALARGWAR